MHRGRTRHAALAGLIAAAGVAWGGSPSAKDAPAERRAALAAQARALAARYGKQFPDGYETHVDARRHVVYVSALGPATLRRVRDTLGRYEDAQRKFLFPAPLRHNIVVLLPTLSDYRKICPNQKVLGFYNRRTHTLASITLSGILVHEFTHALHNNDQLHSGQRHAVWVCEGLATLFQSADVEAGRLKPKSDASLTGLRAALRKGKSVPLAEMFRMSHAAFSDRAEPCYAQSRWVMAYLLARGKLREFYGLYKSHYRSDPAGQIALRVCTERPLKQFEREWREWVLRQPAPWRPLHRPKAHLGVRMEKADAGVQVTGFVRGSVAERAGRLRKGDVIITVGGKPTPTTRHLAEAVQACKPGETVDLEIIRDGRTQTLKHLLGLVRK